jgi:hypothetical protein
MNSMTAASSLPNTVFVDANGNHYIMKDVSAAGDCALLSLLDNPNFLHLTQIPLSLGRGLFHLPRVHTRRTVSLFMA